MGNKEDLGLSEIKFSQVDNRKGVAIGEEYWFLEVSRKGRTWRLRLVDIFGEQYQPLTAWVKVLHFGDLRRTRGKPIRSQLKTWKNSQDILERVLIILQDNRERWFETEEDEESEERVELSDYVENQIEAELDRIRQASNKLDALEPHFDNILVGETKTKKSIFCLASSGKYPEAERKQIILLKGESGGGKSTVQNGVTIGLKTKRVGRFTEHGLDYADFSGYQVLMLKELGGMDLEKQGLSTLKFLSSDDKGYTVEMPIRDPETGRFKNTQYRIPPITVISSTTRLTLDSQFERRTWLFNVDETEEQTKNIILWKAKRKRQEYEKKLGLRQCTDYEFSREVIKRFVEDFKPINVIVPFPKTLTEVLGYDILRVRGDIDKVYSFLEFYGAFNIERLEEIEGPKGKAYMLTPEICVEALQLIVNPLTNMLGKMDQRTKVLLDTLSEMEDIQMEYIQGENEPFEKVVKYDRAGQEIDKKLREKIATKMGKSSRTILRFLNFLESSGMVSSSGGVGRVGKSFTLLYDVDEIKKKITGISAKLETADSLIGEMEKEARKWLKQKCDTKTLRMGKKIQGPTWKNDGKPGKNTPTRSDSVSHLHQDINSPSLAQRSPKNMPKEKRQISHKNVLTLESQTVKKQNNKYILKDGREVYVCPFCANFGEQVCFATEKDLGLHLQRFHGKEPPQYVT